MVRICFWSSILQIALIVVSELNMWSHLMNQLLRKHHLQRHQLQLNLLLQVCIHLFLWNCRFSKPPSTKAQKGSNVPFQVVDNVASFAKLNKASIVKRDRINLPWTFLKNVTVSLGRVVLVVLVSILGETSNIRRSTAHLIHVHLFLSKQKPVA